ncbi:MAG: ETC complex I subunit [Pseudomonadota bacterium]|nr:ETC complex I subunit [Pseudomonadota bacterium]
MLARIYQPAKTAMQSGRAKTHHWYLEFEAEAARRIDPLMGWTSGSDTRAGQVRLTFDSKEEAVAYAERQSIPFQIEEARAVTPVPKAYSDNFAFRRRKPWTH